MEHRQTIGMKKGGTLNGAPSANNRFVFRQSAAASVPLLSPKPVTDAPSALASCFAPPDCAERPKPQDPLLEHDAAHFHRLLTQYWTFPTNEQDPLACVHFNLQAISIIYDLIAKSKRQALTYEDLHQLEMALLRVMPEAVLRSEARMQRARFRAVAPPTLLRQYECSKHTPEDDAACPVEALRAEMATLLSQTQDYWTRGDVRAEVRAAAWRVSACWALGLCVMGEIGSVLTRLLPILTQIAPVIPLLTALLGGAAAFVYIRRQLP